MFTFTEKNYVDNGGKRLWLPDASAMLLIVWSNLVALTDDLTLTSTLSVSDTAKPLLVKLIDMELQNQDGVSSESFEGYGYSREKQDTSNLYSALLAALNLSASSNTGNMVIGAL